MELSRKREAELQKLQHEVEELQMQNETQLGAFRKKHQEVQNEFAEQIDQLNKLRQRSGYYMEYSWSLKLCTTPSSETVNAI